MPARAWLTARPIAHRGLHASPGAPENSLAAAEAAIAGGFAIEVDLVPSADGVAMVFHDATLDRLTAETGRVAARSAAALRKLTVAGSDQTIPTLDDLLDLVGGRTPLFLEIKAGDHAPGAFEAGISARLAGYRGEAAAMSFDRASVAAVARAAPARMRGLVLPSEIARGPFHAALQNLYCIAATRPSFIAYDSRKVPSVATRIARALGLPVLSWTVRSEAERQRVLRFADQIIFEGFLPAMRDCE